MKASHWIIAAAALSFTQPVEAGVNDPELIIYRFPGVLDDGGVTGQFFSGIATVFNCTNFSGVTETIRFVTRDANGALLQNSTMSLDHLQTKAAGTHITNAYSISLSLATGAVAQGTTAIAATSINIICTGITVDAENLKPIFAVSLRGIRFNPASGSQE